MKSTNSTGTYDHTYIYQDGALVARVNPDGSRWFYHSDHLGSTTLITDESGAVVEETFYLPYGEVTSGGSAENRLYTGYFKDLSCEYYAGARYYNPCWGVFIQPDIIFQDVYNPQSLNHYSYTWNNPYNRVDKEGNIVNFIVGGAIGGGINIATQIGFQMAQGKSFWEAATNINWWEVGVSTAVGVATSGVGSLATSLTSGISSTAVRTVAAFGVRATANIALTQLGIAGTNIARGQPATQNLFTPSSIVTPIATAGIQTVISSMSSSSTSSASSGRLGGPEHRATVASVGESLESKGWNIVSGGGGPEKGVYIPGTGNLRFPDVAAVKGSQQLFVQVGRSTTGGQMVSREVSAFIDLSKVATTKFVPYDIPFTDIQGVR